MTRHGLMVVVALALVAAPACTQTGQAPAEPAAEQAERGMPVKDGLRGTYDSVKQWITAAADQVPEDLYAFQPTPEVRTFGQIFGHVANSNFMICAQAGGGANPNQTNFEEAATKAEIVQGLHDAFAYCDGVFDQMTEAQAHEMMTLFGREQPRLSALSFNTAHDYEHYGNIVTYMRLKGMVPPSSQ